MSLNDEGINNLFNHVMEIWVNPETERRKKAGKIPENYFIDKIQVVIPPGQVPFIRFNDEVKAIILAKAKPGIKEKKKDGDLIYQNELDHLVKISLPEDENPNYGHLTMLLLDNHWHIYFDFRTNRQKSYERYKAGKEFLEAAENNIKGSKRVFVDNLFSAVELFVTSQLFIMSEEKYVNKPTHRYTTSRYNDFIKIGNYKNEFKDLFNKLGGLRNKGRYLSGAFSLSDIDAKEMIKTAHDLGEFTLRRIG